MRPVDPRYSTDPPRRGWRVPTMMERAMIEAVIIGLDGAVAHFLSEGANPNGVDEHGAPILHLTFSHQSDEPSIEKIARMMVAAGANPRAPHGAGPGLPERIISVFSASQAARMIDLISSLGFDIDARGPRDRTALMLAAERLALGSEPVVEALLRAGADPGLEDDQGRSAYARAESMGNKDALIKMAVSQERSTLKAVVSEAKAPARKRAPL